MILSASNRRACDENIFESQGARANGRAPQYPRNSRIAAMKRGLCIATIGAVCALAQPALALCPFHVGPSGAPSGTATTDGLLFLRFSAGFSGPDAVVGAAPAGSAAPDVLAFIQKNGAALNVDGDQFISSFDMMVITRYLLGFRGDALVADLQPRANSTRIGGTAIQAFIDGGCPTSPDPLIQIWTAMTAQLAKGTPEGIEAAKQYMTDTAQNNYVGALVALTTELPTMMSSFSSLIPLLIEDRHAQYWVSVPLEGSQTGERSVHLITFLRTFDGKWLIDAM